MLFYKVCLNEASTPTRRNPAFLKYMKSSRKMRRLLAKQSLGLWIQTAWVSLRLYMHLGLELLYRLQKGLAAGLLGGILGAFMAVHQQALGELCLLPAWGVKGILLAFLAGGLFWGRFTPWLKRLCLWGICVGLGYLVALGRFHPVEVPAYLNAQFVRLPGKLLPHEKGVVLETRHLDTATNVHILLKTGKNAPALPPVGSQTCVSGFLKLGQAPRFLGDFNERQYLQGMGVAGTLFKARVNEDCLQYESIETGVPPSVSWLRELYLRPLPWIFKKRQAFIHDLQAGLGLNAGSLLGGMVLGDRASPLPAALKKAFVETGQIHLVAASGMNVAIIAAGLLFVLRLIPRLPRGLAFTLASIGVVFYGEATGFPPSILRAVVMWLIGLWMKYLFRPLNPLFLLLVAITFLIVVEPQLCLSLGFQLSVLTTFGLVTLYTQIEAYFKTQGWDAKRSIGVGILSAGALTAVAQLYATPLLLFTFYQIPLHAIVMNLLSGLLVAPLTVWGFLGFGLFCLSPICAKFFLFPTQYLLQLQVAWTLWGASFPQLQWSTVALPSWWMFSTYAVLLSLPWWKRAWFFSTTLSKWVLKGKAFAFVLGGGIIALVIFPFYWDATRFQRHAPVEWISLPVGETARREGVKLLHYNPRPQNPSHFKSILFLSHPLSYWDIKDLAGYFKAQHLPPPEEVVLLELPLPSHLKVKKTQAKKYHPKKKRKKYQKTKSKKHRLSDATKRLHRLEKNIRRLSKGDVQYLSKASQRDFKKRIEDTSKSKSTKEESLFLIAFFDQSPALKLPKLGANEEAHFVKDVPTWVMQPPTQATWKIRLPASPSQAETDIFSQARTEKKQLHKKKYKKLKKRHSASKKALRLKQKRGARRRLQAEAFERALREQWPQIQVSRWDHHQGSLLEWHFAPQGSLQLRWEAADFRLKNNWHAYDTPHGRRYQLHWERLPLL
jgi:ComEC/Rec2-related protein